MKIKLDFVTNSSSACYLLSIPENSLPDLLTYISELNQEDEASNEGVRTYFSATTLNELQEYTHDGPFDWASKPGGLQYINLTEDSYNTCKEIIDNRGTVIEVWVDYGVCEIFDNDWKDNIIRECS